jgi:hypothetical protein
MNYELAYRIGFHPWEDAEEEPGFVERIFELVAREENGHGPPYGRALDVGTGIWGVELAKRGGRSPASTSSRRPCDARATGYGAPASTCGSCTAT